MSDNKENIMNLTIEELELRMPGFGEKAYRAKQIAEWIYQKGAADFSMMTSLPASLRAKLEDAFEMKCLNTVKVESGSDGAKKILWKLRDGTGIESVVIPGDEEKATLCVSSQAGCPLACRFCMTGKSGFVRNLETPEIVSQIIEARRLVEPRHRITNIVLMGMGEPFLNFSRVTRALKIMTSERCLGFSPRRITVSTSGVIDRIAEFGALKLASLAVSINAPDNTTRTSIMPVNKKYPLDKLIAECRKYPATRREPITFEYVLLGDVNNSPAAAKQLAAILRGIECRINLIVFNECKGIDFESPDMDSVLRFSNILLNAGYDVFRRESRGRDISAACGQLGASLRGGS